MSPTDTSFDEGVPNFDRLKDAIPFFTERKSKVDEGTLLKQYELLRGEVNASLAAQLQILSLGTATLGLVAGSAFVGAEDAFRGDVLVVFLPLLAYMTLIIWFSEVTRMLRAGSFLLRLEKRLDDEGDGSLAWEASVWRGRTGSARLTDEKIEQRRIGYYSVFDPDQLRLLAVTLLFFTIAVSSIVMGWTQATAWQRWFAVGAGVLAFLAVVLVYHQRLGQVGDTLNVKERPALTRHFIRIARALRRHPEPTTGKAPPAPHH